MRVTVTQWDNRPEEFDVQWTALRDHCQSQRTEFLLLPEMPFDHWLAAEDIVSEGLWSAACARHEQIIARFDELGVPFIVSSCPIMAYDGRRVNQGYLWRDDGLVPVHAKYYLPEEPGFWEARWYDRGDGDFREARAGIAKFGLQICTEMWFTDHARAYGQAGCDLLCVPRAVGHGSLDKWLAGGRTAAVVSGAFCLSANLYQPPGATKADLGGLSWIIDPDGEVLATTSPEVPFVTLDLDLDVAKAAKSTYPRYVRT